jgi:hypothetical protein
VPWIAWRRSATWSRISRAPRSTKTLILHKRRLPARSKAIRLKTVDGPNRRLQSGRQDGGFSALQNGVSDIFCVGSEHGNLVNVTKDDIADFAPPFARRTHDRLHRARQRQRQAVQAGPRTGKKNRSRSARTTTRRQVLHANTIVFTSTAIDPSVAITPEVARNATSQRLDARL